MQSGSTTIHRILRHTHKRSNRCQARRPSLATPRKRCLRAARPPPPKKERPPPIRRSHDARGAAGTAEEGTEG